jgi:hypothetical protein
MGDLMFREMFSVFEQLATFLATILVRRHCASPTRIPPALASYGSPALSGSLKINSSAANAQTYVSSQPARAGDYGAARDPRFRWRLVRTRLDCGRHPLSGETGRADIR